jgi:N-acetylglucosaminyldiphosphoundecaprenol N-acetyl-beta-D-mannosaminyltransferase
MLKQIDIFGIKTMLAERKDFAALVAHISEKPNQSMFFCNVHMLMLAQEDPVLAEAMNSADVVFADSAPIAWLQRRVTGGEAEYIPGYKIMFAIFERAVKNDENVGFIGSTPDVMQQLVQSLTDRFKGLLVTYQHSPPFMRDELVLSQQELQNLVDAEVEWLFVGLGCPKQENGY